MNIQLFLLDNAYIYLLVIFICTFIYYVVLKLKGSGSQLVVVLGFLFVFIIFFFLGGTIPFFQWRYSEGLGRVMFTGFLIAFVCSSLVYLLVRKQKILIHSLELALQILLYVGLVRLYSYDLLMTIIQLSLVSLFLMKNKQIYETK